METKPDSGRLPDTFNPLAAGWEAASRWNEVTLGWVTRGFQQWLTLMTTVPPRPDLSSSTRPQARETELREDRPAAHREQREPKRPPRVQAKARSKSKPKARAKG
jgi:hypothetical protein